MDSKTCTHCGKEIASLPFKCKFCGSEFCVEHRLPESHSCLGLAKVKEMQLESLKQGKPEKPLEYFYEKHKQPQLRIFYYLILAIVTLISIFVISRVLS